MSTADRNEDETGPPPFSVYYNPRVHLFKLVAILAIIAILVLMPNWVEDAAAESIRVLYALAAIFLIWAYLTAVRARDRRPQVVVDGNGVFVRDWHVEQVPWEDIEFIAHSSSVRRGIVASLTRSRRGPYLLFKFARVPKFVPSTPPPFSWLQKLWVDMEMQEPAIIEFGLDTKATVILRAIQDHISHWQGRRSGSDEDAAIITPQTL